MGGSVSTWYFSSLYSNSGVSQNKIINGRHRKRVAVELGIVLAYCFHHLTGQRFSGEHLDSFLVRNKKIREEEMSIL
jgi:hypothetical protein